MNNVNFVFPADLKNTSSDVKQKILVCKCSRIERREENDGNSWMKGCNYQVFLDQSVSQ